MTRLAIECLEGRTLLSALPVTGFTPPLGSDKGSVIGEPSQMEPSGIAGDGLGTVGVKGKAEGWAGSGAS
jgi:hypothetical protein